jgi:tetratricopeptide (TPR) repeat protein
MLTRFFRLQKLSNEPLKEAVNQRLSHLVPPDPQLTQLLMTLVAPPTEADGPGLRFANVRERHLALHRLLSQLSRTRPVVLWLDDAPWSRDSVEFCLSTFDPDSPPLSVLFVLTARSNSPGNAPGAESLRTLFEQERVQHCPLSPLPKSDRPTFLRELLGLSSALAAEVDRRSDGNPLYAIQLVGDWVRQRLLRPGPDGFLFDGDRTNTGIPDSLHELWIQRITRWAASRPERDSHALELAALLGPIIDGDEWQQALHCAHIEGSPGLFSSLVEHGLLQLNHRERGGEWALTHGLLAESLIRRAREAERDKHHHRACADMLLSKDHPQHAERLGRHLLAAGAYSEALGPLLVSAEQALNTEDWSGFDDILRLRQQAIQVACPHAFSVAYGESLILRSRVAARRKQLHLLPPILDELQTVADTHDSRHFAAYAALGRCSLQFWTGELKQARKQAELALALAEQDKDRRASGRIRSIQTAILRFQGAYEEALTAAARGAADFASCEARQEQVQCQVLQATVLLQMGQYESAETTLNAALAASEKMGFRYGIGHAEAILGELRRHQQHFPAAITHYERSIANFREIGLDSTAPQCNLAALRLQQGQFERARETLNTLELRLQKKKMLQIFLPFCRLLLAVCAAYYEDWVLWKNYFSFSNKTLRAQPLLDRDTVFYLNLAGQIALEKGAFEQSRAALELAHFTASKMDRPDLLATVEAVLHRLAQAEDAAS